MMDTNFTKVDTQIFDSEVKSMWITPNITELDIKNTNSNDYYNEDGFGPGASLS